MHLTTTAVAQRWGVNRSTVNRYRVEGLLLPLGKRGAGTTASFVFSLEEVLRFERDNRLIVEPSPPR